MIPGAPDGTRRVDEGSHPIRRLRSLCTVRAGMALEGPAGGTGRVCPRWLVTCATTGARNIDLVVHLGLVEVRGDVVDGGDEQPIGTGGDGLIVVAGSAGPGAGVRVAPDVDLPELDPASAEPTLQRQAESAAGPGV